MTHAAAADDSCNTEIECLKNDLMIETKIVIPLVLAAVMLSGCSPASEDLAVTADVPKFDKKINTVDIFSHFSKHRICSQKFHINYLELLFSPTFTAFRCASFPC